MESTEWHQMIGLAGTFFYIGSYFLLQAGKLRGDGIAYVVLNMAAASLVLFSVTYKFNLASTLIQVSWILISFVGLIRIVSSKQESDSAPVLVKNR